MSDSTTTVINLVVLSLLPIAIPVSYHLGRTADHQAILEEPTQGFEEPTMGCEIVQDQPFPHAQLIPRNLQCKRAGDHAFLCK